jgi:hypothetical protein
MTYFWKFLVWLDYTANDKWFRGRWELGSGRMYRRHKQGKCPLCGWVCAQLGKVDPDHCRKAYISDRKRNPDLPV